MPIIALTANAFQQEREQCLDNGFDDFIKKPVTNPVLASTLAIYASSIRRAKKQLDPKAKKTIY